MENRTNAEYMARPEWIGQKSRRALVMYWRACAAWDMAYSANQDAEGVTRDEWAAAYALLDSCMRYGRAAARQWELANTSERYANVTQCEQDEKRLDARREKLQRRLAAYGARLVNYGLYPSIERTNRHAVPVSLYFD